MLGTEKFVKEQDGINYGIDKCVSKSKSNTNISTNNSIKNNICILQMYIDTATIYETFNSDKFRNNNSSEYVNVPPDINADSVLHLRY